MLVESQVHPSVYHSITLFVFSFITQVTLTSFSSVIAGSPHIYCLIYIPSSFPAFPLLRHSVYFLSLFLSQSSFLPRLLVVIGHLIFNPDPKSRNWASFQTWVFLTGSFCFITPFSLLFISYVHVLTHSLPPIKHHKPLYDFFMILIHSTSVLIKLIFILLVNCCLRGKNSER